MRLLLLQIIDFIRPVGFYTCCFLLEIIGLTIAAFATRIHISNLSNSKLLTPAVNYFDWNSKPQANIPVQYCSNIISSQVIELGTPKVLSPPVPFADKRKNKSQKVALNKA